MTFISQRHWLRLRYINQRIKEAGPAEPALILGLNGAPAAGDTFHVVESDQEAREITNKHHHPQEIGRCYNYEILKVLTLIITPFVLYPSLEPTFSIAKATSSIPGFSFKRFTYVS